MEAIVGQTYTSKLCPDLNNTVMVTAIGMENILYMPLPMTKFNGRYFEYCLTRDKFNSNFVSIRSLPASMWD